MMQEVPFLSRCCKKNCNCLFIRISLTQIWKRYAIFHLKLIVQTANCFFPRRLSIFFLLPNHFLHYFIPQAHCHTQYFKKVYCSREDFFPSLKNIPQKFPSTATTTNTLRHDDGDDDDEEEKNFFLFECHHQKFIVQKDVERRRRRREIIK